MPTFDPSEVTPSKSSSLTFDPSEVTPVKSEPPKQEKSWLQRISSWIPDSYAETQERIARTEGEAAKKAGETLIEYSPITGVPEMTSGLKNVVSPEQGTNRRQAARKVISGVGKTLAPLAVPAAMAAPLATIGGIAGGMAVQQGTEQGLRALGVDEDTAGLAGDIAGFIPPGAAARRVVSAVRKTPKPAPPIPEPAPPVADVPPPVEPLPSAKAIPDPPAASASLELPPMNRRATQRGSVSNRQVAPATPSESYAKQKIADREAARKAGDSGILSRVMSVVKDAKTKAIDSTATITDTLAKAQKDNAFEIRPEYDIDHQIDRAFRSTSLASQKIEKSGLPDVIRKVDDLDYLDQYLVAKQAKSVEQQGFATGRDRAADDALIAEFAPRYEPFAQPVKRLNDDMLTYSVDAGLVDPEVAAIARQLYPDYVPTKRIIELSSQGAFGPAGRGPASLSKQTVFQALKGSEREIENPLASTIDKVYAVYAQGERNKAARMLADYRDLPGFQGLITEVPQGASPGKHSISFLEGGKKRTFNTTPEIEAAAKSLDRQSIGLIGQILSAPVRLFKVGTTGVNLPFVAANIAADVGFTGITAASRNSAANPLVFLKSIASALKHDGLYDELISQGGGFTSFDLSRGQARRGIEDIRASRSLGSQGAYAVSHPIRTAQSLFRAAEDLVSRSEQVGRLRLYKGERDSQLAKGRTATDARILAAKESNNALPNYLRAGDWTRVLNSVVPYLNASVQGTRSFARRAQEAPAETAARVGITLYAPVAFTTMWNLSDPERRKAYEDIKAYEKENNIIWIPPNPKKNDKGEWEVIKIKVPPGVSNLAMPVRRGIEQMYGLDPVRFGEMAKAAIGTVSPVEPDMRSVLSTLTPQAIKPTLQAQANYDFFRDAPKVGPGLQEKPAPLQFDKNTSGTARLIGEKFNVSPKKVEEFTKDTLGGIAPQLINKVDQAAAAFGVIPKDQVRGQETLPAIAARFSSARGGETEQKEFSRLKKIESDNSQDQVRVRRLAEKALKDLSSAAPDQHDAMIDALPPDVLKELSDILDEKDKPKEGIDRVLKSRPTDVRAKYMLDALSAAPPEQQDKLLDRWIEEGVLTQKVAEAIEAQLTAQ